MERELCKRHSGVAQLALSDRALQKKYDRVGRGSCGNSICGSRRSNRAQGRSPRVSWLENDGVLNWCSSIESGKCFAIGVTAPGIDVDRDLALAGVTLRRGLHSSEKVVRKRVTTYQKSLTVLKWKSSSQIIDIGDE